MWLFWCIYCCKRKYYFAPFNKNKNNAAFINCVSKVNGVQIDIAKDLDVIMPMYKLLEYSQNYRKTIGSLWSYYRDEPSNPLSSNSKYFK